ncbi:MAG TPA: sugar phosphate isomerase/epimerase family protein [Candidatus Xenobia bacterium]
MSDRRFLLGYNTCGFSHTTDIDHILRVIHSTGYQGVELTLDKRHYHPHHHDRSVLERIKSFLTSSGMVNVLATGARYVLSDVKHEPSMVSADDGARTRWMAFLVESIKMGEELQSDCVMLHSGYQPKGVEKARAWDWMVQEVTELCRVAREHGQRLGMEFHPDMFLRTYDDFKRLKQDVGAVNFGLTLDVGHCECTESTSTADIIRECLQDVFNIHLDDIDSRVHKHLMLGQGQIDFKEIFRVLSEVGYRGLASVELNADDIGVADDELAVDSYGYLVERVSKGPFIIRRPAERVGHERRRRHTTGELPEPGVVRSTA